MNPFFSIIIPVYNRSDELKELLDSLIFQSYDHFEVIVVDDGSAERCENLVLGFREKLNIRYFFKSNSGPGPTRNFGFKEARGDYFISFDSDCVIPTHYLAAVVSFMSNHQVDAWGGSDVGHPSFSRLQQAMAFTMSAFLTTGGIRGSKIAIDHFQPRSFNMGISRSVFEITGGFRFDRFAEDIELSVRIKKAGFNSWLIPDAFVYHKRRTSLFQFFNQVRNFGRGRIEVSRVHPDTLRLTHWLPLVFTCGWILGLSIGFIFLPILLITAGFYLLYFLALFTGALLHTRSFITALLTIPSALTQLTGYALGFVNTMLGKNH